MEDFLANICSAQWNPQQDAGRSFSEACAALKLEHPDKADVIDAWFERFDEMMPGPIAGTVDILAERREREVPRLRPEQLVSGNLSFCAEKIRVPAVVPCNLPLCRSALGQTRSVNL